MVEEAKGKCLFCHILGSPDGASQSAQFKGANSNTQVSESRTLFPTVEKTAIPERWLPFSTFDHKAHSILTCVACHEAAPHSKETKDVLLPSIGSCRNCHLSRAERKPNVSHVTSITISPRRRSLAIICIRSKSLRLGYEPRDREG